MTNQSRLSSEKPSTIWSSTTTETSCWSSTPLGADIAKLCLQNTMLLPRSWLETRTLSSPRSMPLLTKFRESTSKVSQPLNSTQAIKNHLPLLISKEKEKKKASSNGSRKKPLILGLKSKKKKKTSERNPKKLSTSNLIISSI